MYCHSEQSEESLSSSGMTNEHDTSARGFGMTENQKLFIHGYKNGLPIGDVTFTDTGKPYLLDSSIYFSLSHSHGICAVAISDHLVGVDVEIIKTSYPPHLIERSLTDAEKAVYDGDFTHIWCRKEAVAKMTGEGITEYPVTIDTTKYKFNEQQIEWNGQKYWLVAVAD